MATAEDNRLASPIQKTLGKSNADTLGTVRARSIAGPLYVVSLERYGKDSNFSIYFPDSISMSYYLFDATLTEGDCKIRVTLDPSLNRLVFKNELHCGSLLRNVVFSVGEESDGGSRSISVTSLEVDNRSGSDATLRALSAVNVKSLPWLDGEPTLLPLRAQRSTYLPLWNSHDFTGKMWRDTPPSIPDEEEDSEDELEGPQPTVTLGELRRKFLAGSRQPKGTLHVKILHISRLMYYGKADKSSECPYKAELLVGDGSLKVCVVLWNSLCLDWYRSLQPGQVLRLSRYRVKQSYSSRSAQDTESHIEISLNSRNPAAKIHIISQRRVSPEWSLPDLPHSFISGQDLISSPHGNVCDVIGVVVFAGRPERIRSQGMQRGDLEEYRWVQLEDGTIDKPIMIKLYSTSQPDIQSRIHPMALLVCTRLQVIRFTVGRATSLQYLTNTPQTQVYCTGTGPRPVMPYKGVRPVKRFLQWLKRVDENTILNKTVVGGYFTYPPLPASLQTYMDNRQGERGLLSGSELKLECDRLHYRETRRLTIQCTITSASYHNREDGWRRQCVDNPSSAQLSPRIPRIRDGSESFRTPKRKLFASSGTPRKRLALPLQQSTTEEGQDSEFSLFDGAMEFLLGDEEDEDDDDEDDDDEGFGTPPTSPCSPHLGLAQVAMETVPRSFCYTRRQTQATAVGMQTNSFHKLLPQHELESFSPAPSYKGHYTLTLRALSDGMMIDAIFLPAAPGNEHWRPLPLPHPNTWESILSHGGFSPEAPPPSPADLIATAAHMTNQRLMCVLEACALGGDRVELVLSRAYRLRS